MVIRTAGFFKVIAIMKRLFGIFEAVMLMVVGLAALWFALSPYYSLLINPRFKWITVTGAILVLVMGGVNAFSRQKRGAINVLIFCLMLLIVLVGRPYSPSANSAKMEEPEMPAGLWAQVDQKKFPRRNLDDLFLKDTNDKLTDKKSFTTIGTVKRLPVLDESGSFAMMTSVMVCCVADAFAVGFRIPYEQWEKIEDGQLIMVSGKLVKPGTVLDIPNFRFGMAMMSTIHDEFIIEPESVMTYDRVAQLPLLTDKLNSDNLSLFRKALEQTGLWQTLMEEGPFTVFAPVDQAMESLDEELFADAERESLKELLSYHIVPGKYFSKNLMERKSLKSINGYKLTIELEYGKLKVHEVRILFKDQEAKNGVIHYIYPAIIPTEFKPPKGDAK
jgi:uncharacterized surface protein with fasciclin (FAS1) repeats